MHVKGPSIIAMQRRLTKSRVRLTDEHSIDDMCSGTSEATPVSSVTLLVNLVTIIPMLSPIPVPTAYTF